MSVNDPITQEVNGSPSVPVEPQTKKDYFLETLRNARRGCALNAADIDALIEYFEAQ